MRAKPSSSLPQWFEILFSFLLFLSLSFYYCPSSSISLTLNTSLSKNNWIHESLHNLQSLAAPLATDIFRNVEMHCYIALELTLALTPLGTSLALLQSFLRKFREREVFTVFNKVSSRFQYS